MNEETFLSALREEPTDEVTWLALADWFDENGQTQRAELLRLTRRLRTMPVHERDEVRGRVVDLLEEGVRPVVVERQNSLGMRFALVPPARFVMGTPPEEEDRRADERQHEVEITKPFWLGVFLVTQAQWKQVMGNNPSFFSAEGEGREDVEGVDTDQFPVECVSWEDSQAFVKKLNGLAAEKEGGWKYRLPTEAEWEHACRGAVGFVEPFLFTVPSDSLDSTLAQAGDEPRRTCPVGEFDPNPLGIHDLHGNVWEWCHDWYGDYPNRPLTKDPRGPVRGEERVIRGGGWADTSDLCRTGYRFQDTPDSRYEHLGLRIASDHRRPAKKPRKRKTT